MPIETRRCLALKPVPIEPDGYRVFGLTRMDEPRRGRELANDNLAPSQGRIFIASGNRP